MINALPIDLKSPQEIEVMRSANLIVHEVLCALRAMVCPGVSTLDLDRKAAELTKERGANTAFFGYPARSPNVKPFPGVICASVNQEIVHGIPNPKPLSDGDIVSIDFGCCYQGFFGDSAITVAVGNVTDQASALLDVTNQSLEDAIRECQVGKRIGDISHAVQQRVERAGFGIVREFVGHGIGRKMHEPPSVPNFGRAGQGRVLRAGMVLAIEPMVTVGSFETRLLEDGWTAITRDGSLAAHFEHTVAITDKGPYVLSRP